MIKACKYMHYMYFDGAFEAWDYNDFHDGVFAIAQYCYENDDAPEDLYICTMVYEGQKLFRKDILVKKDFIDSITYYFNEMKGGCYDYYG